MQDTLSVQTPEQARLLLDVACQKLLAVLIAGEAGAAEVARETGQDVKRVHDRLGRLERAGLIVIVGERPRAGRPVRLYRAAARTFRVPFALTDAGTLAELVERACAPYLRATWLAIEAQQRHEAALELLVSSDEHGQLRISRQPVGGRPRSKPHPDGPFVTYGELNLTPGTRREAEVKLRELAAWLWERSAAEGHLPGAAPCLLGLSLAPGEVRASGA